MWNHFLSSDHLSEHRIGLVVIELPCVRFTFPTRIICKGISDFVTGCSCGGWRCGLTTWLLYVSPLFNKTVWNELIGKCHVLENSFFLVLCKYNNSIHWYTQPNFWGSLTPIRNVQWASSWKGCILITKHCTILQFCMIICFKIFW